MLKDFVSKVYSECSDSRLISSTVAQKIKFVCLKTPDKFYNFIKDEPEFKTAEFGAYVCGLIELLHNKTENSFEIPSWVFNDRYFLEKPYSSIHKYLKVSENLKKVTPKEFSKRNYYTNENGVLV